MGWPLWEIDIVYRTMFSELAHRSFDAQFQVDYPIDGRFVSLPIKARITGILTFPCLAATRGNMLGLMPIPRKRIGSRGFAMLRSTRQIAAVL